MPQPIPYLGFDGACADAMRFYERVLGGTLEPMLRLADMPTADPTAAPVPAELRDRIMHACLKLPDGHLLYAGDAPPGVAFDGIRGVSITLTYDTPEEARRIFDALADGGSVSMPIAPTFWARTFGMCTDRWGVPWAINGGMVPMPS